MQVKVWNMKGEEVGAVELPGEVFGMKPSQYFLHELVTAYCNNRRRWTAHTKTRAEVSGGGRKPWKQKHTGRARAGSIRSPLWRKGGIAFGPRYVAPKFRRHTVSRRKSRMALAQALSARTEMNGLRVLQSLVLDGIKTRQIVAMLKQLRAGTKPLVVVDQQDPNLVIAGRNVAGLKVMLASHLNAYEVLRCDTLILTQAAVEKMRSRWN